MATNRETNSKQVLAVVGILLLLIAVFFGLVVAAGSQGLFSVTATPTATATLAPLTATAKVLIVTATGQPTVGPTLAPTATTAATTAAPTVQPTTAAPTVATTPTTQAVIVQVGSKAQLGQFLVDAQGMTLYTFANDPEGNTTCVDDCEVEWPPLTVAAGTQLTAGPGVPGQLTTITRPNGALQVTYNGHPLYHYSGDHQPGDTLGHRMMNLWFVAVL